MMFKYTVAVSLRRTRRDWVSCQAANTTRGLRLAMSNTQYAVAVLPCPTSADGKKEQRR